MPPGIAIANICLSTQNVWSEEESLVELPSAWICVTFVSPDCKNRVLTTFGCYKSFVMRGFPNTSL